jgi:hypothetical protein
MAVNANALVKKRNNRRPKNGKFLSASPARFPHGAHSQQIAMGMIFRCRATFHAPVRDRIVGRL